MRSTAEIKVPEKIIDQVIGQDEAVNTIKKAALQRRHVLLIGDPGTGKSMLGLALAELLPKSELKDILSYFNPNDENTPLIKELPAGQGRDEAKKYQLSGSQGMKNNNFLLFIVAIITLIAPWWVRYHYQSDIMFAAFFIGGMMFLAAVSLIMGMGQRMFRFSQEIAPKLIVDNFGKKQAPFYDATGSHAGALLGDVLHDPFQTFFTGQELQIIASDNIKKRKINEEIDEVMNKYKEKILKKKEKNYEAVFLPQNEFVVMGETNGSLSPVDVLSCNRYDYVGEMVKLTTAENKELIVTPEHKIAVYRGENMEYIEAKNITKGDYVVAQMKNILINDQDLIKMYKEKQWEQCKLYFEYHKIKAQNPNWGYKRISKALGQPEAKTRWWNAHKHIPVPIQTTTWLREKGLLPLTFDNPKLPLIAKVLGATFGDGGIFDNLNGIFLSSSEKKAVEEFGNDIERIFSLPKNQNSRIIEGGAYGHSWCYQNTNRNIIYFFLALGAPRGNKTKIELKVPKWIKVNSDFESEFYGSILGGELGTPIIHKNGNYLTSLELGITGLPQFKENRVSFLGELAQYLKKNRVNTTSIYEGKYKTEGSIIFRLLIEKKIDNVLLFITNIKINYCTYKIDRLYKALGQWAKLKKNKYHELVERGYGAEHAMKTLNLTPNSLYLLLNHFGPPEAEA
ncbi:ATP-binding protein [Candidatus Woesearchaeota archaeon]|nr:ATP-binding protein [Candidatus Woesearchaeota archaeon]